MLIAFVGKHTELVMRNAYGVLGGLTMAYQGDPTLPVGAGGDRPQSTAAASAGGW
jgi:hypothetical protein